MKIIHFADAHIDFGKNMGQVDPTERMAGRVLDCLDMIDSIIDFAEDENVDLIIFAGDAFHTYNPNPLYVNAFAKRLARMRRICPVFLLVGNHDMSPVTSSVEIYSSIELDNVIVGSEYKVHIIDTRSGKVQVAAAPYPSRKYKKDIADIVYHLGDTITDEYPSILVGHFTVSGCQYGAERDFAYTDDSDIPLEILADTVWDYVALGHIHYHQCLNETPPVVYSGSPDRVTFGEENEDKGFVLVTIDGETKWEFIQLDARPYKTVEIKTLSSNPMEKIIRKLQSVDLTSKVVRVIIRVKEQYLPLIDKRAVAELLEASGTYILSSLVYYRITDDVDRSTVRLAEGISSASSHIELLTAYLDVIGSSPADTKELVNMAEIIMKEVNDEFSN